MEDAYAHEYGEQVVKYEADESTVSSLLHQLADDPAHHSPGSDLRMIAADALQDQGDEVSAAQLRSELPITGYTHGNGQNLYVTQPSGVNYPLGTHPDAINALETARRYNYRVHISSGDHDTGKDWLEERGVVGRLSTSSGKIRIPILVGTSRGSYGDPVGGKSIVRIRTAPAGHVLYQHPNYHHGEITLTNNLDYHPDLPYQVQRDGGVHAAFRTELAARRFVKKLGLKLSGE